MEAIAEQINQAGKAFVDFSLPMLIQSSLLIAILFGLDLILRKKVRSVFRYCLWLLILAKLVIPPSFSTPAGVGNLFGDKLAEFKIERTEFVSELNPETINAQQPMFSPTLEYSKIVPQRTEREFYQKQLPSENLTQTQPPLTQPPIQATPAVSITWQGAVFVGWLAVVIAMLMLVIQRAIFVRGLVRQAELITGGLNDLIQSCRNQLCIKSKITLKSSPNATSPAVCGLFRPVILLPRGLLARLTREQIKTVFIHELIHIKRGDLWINLVQTLLQIVYFYNPLLWLANAMIRRIREQAVDEAVQVALGKDAETYPRILLDVAKLSFKRSALSLRLIGVVESKSALKTRIARLLSRPIPKKAKLGILGLLIIIVIGSILLPMARDADQKVRDISDILNITDKSGQLYIQSISMPVLTGSTDYLDMAVKVENRSDSAMYLGLEYYLDLGKYNAVFSPGAGSLATIREIPPGFKGDVQYPVSNRRPAKNAYMRVQLAKCPTKTSFRNERNIQSLSPDCEIIWDKKYYITGNNGQTTDSNKPQSATEKNQTAMKNEGIDLPVRFISSDSDGKVERYQWRLNLTKDVRLAEHSFIIEGDSIRGYWGDIDGTSTRPSDGANVDYQLIVSKEGEKLDWLMREKQSREGLSNYDDTASSTRKLIEQTECDQIKTYIFKETAGLSEKYLPLLKRDFIEDGSVIRTLLFAVRMVGDNEDDPFVPTIKDIKDNAKDMLEIEKSSEQKSDVQIEAEKQTTNKPIANDSERQNLKRVYFNTISYPDKALVLDLTSGEKIFITANNFNKPVKGDILFGPVPNSSNQFLFTCFRGTKMSLILNGKVTSLIPDFVDGKQQFAAYFIREVPCAYEVETPEGGKYTFKLISIENKGDYKEALVEYWKSEKPDGQGEKRTEAKLSSRVDEMAQKPPEEEAVTPP